MAVSSGNSGLNFKSCLVVHLVIFAWYVFALRTNCSEDITKRHPGVRTYGGRWKYLTNINLIMQMVFFGLCVITDLTHVIMPSRHASSGLPSVLRKVQHFFFTVFAFPLSVFVCVSFWSIYTYNRELVFPKFLDEVVPLWLNHAMHTVILPLVLVQMFLQNHKHPSRSEGILTLSLFAALYLAWVLWVRHASGIWVYPILAHLSPVGLVLFISGASLSTAPLYLLGEKLNQMIWRSAGNPKTEKTTQ